MFSLDVKLTKKGKIVLITIGKCGNLTAISPKDFPQAHLGREGEEKEEVEEDELQRGAKEGGGERM